MSDNLDIAIRFEAAGTARTVRDINRIDAAVEQIDQRNIQTEQNARALADAYGLTASEALQVEAALVAIAEESEQVRQQLTGITTALSAAVAAGIGGLFSQALQDFQQFESFEGIFDNLFGDQAEREFSRVEDFAANTPFELDQVVDGFLKLQNRGIQPTNEQLRQLGDLTSSQSKDLDQIVEAILDAQTGEFERLKEFGINASAQGDQVAISFRGVTEEVARTPQAIADAIFALGDLEGIAGAMAVQSETLGGRLSNLSDEATKASVSFGEFANLGARPVVDAAIELVGAFNALPTPIQRTLIATTALTGVLAAAVAAVTAYNLANGQRIVQEAVSIVNTTRKTIATTAETAAVAAATVAQSLYAAATGQATAAQIAQVAAIQSAAVAFAAVAGAAASVAIVVDTFLSATEQAREIEQATRDVQDALDSLNGDSLEVQVRGNVEALNDEINVLQRGLDRVRDALGLDTVAETATRNAELAFTDLVASVQGVRIAANETAEALENGITVPPAEIEQTVAAIDTSIAALERQVPVTEEATAAQELQIQKLQEYRDRITDTAAGLTALSDSTDDLKNRLKSLNDEIDQGDAQIENAGAAAVAAVEQQSAAQEISAEERQSRLRSIEENGLNDRIALSVEKLGELRELEREATDPEAVEQIQSEILKIETDISNKRAEVARSTQEVIEAREKAAAEAAIELAKERADAIEEARQRESDAATRAFEDEQRSAQQANQTQSRDTQNAFDNQQQLQRESFEANQRAIERQFQDSQQSIERQFQDSQQSSERQFQDSQQSDQQAFQDSLNARQESFNDRQREAERSFQESLNQQRSQGNAELDALETEVNNRIALAEASTREERQAIRERLEAEEEAAELRREVEADVLRERNQVLSDADLELTPLEQARVDLENRLQAKEDEFRQAQEAEKEAFEASQREAEQAFEDEQDAAALAFEEEKREAERVFDDEQREAERVFDDEQRAAERAFEDEQEGLKAAFEDEQRALKQAFEDEQREIERAFKDEQRRLDEESAERVKQLIESARQGQSLRGGGIATGGVVQVHKDEFLLPPRGTRVVSQVQSRALIREHLISSRQVTAAAVPSTKAIEKKLDAVLTALTARARPRLNQTINLGAKATEFDALQAAMNVQRLQFKDLGL